MKRRLFMRSKFRHLFVFTMAVAIAWRAAGGDILDIFRSKPNTNQTTSATGALASLSQEEMASGLKQALTKGVQQAVASLGRTNGFLTNLNVRIPMPEGLQRIDKTLRSLRQDKLADEFVTAMNHAAEQAVPEAAAVLGDSV